MRWQLPPLNPLRCFEAAARHGSITNAALELHVTQAAVSKQIRALEIALRQRLFVRLHREIRLTSAGEEYFSTITRLFGELDGATRSITSRRERVRVRFMGYNTFNLRWLIPRLADFYSHYPHIEIEVSDNLEPIDFSRHRVDCAVRTGRGEWSDCTSVLVAPIEFKPICKPLGPTDPPLDQIEDLRHHTLIMSATRSNVWDHWLKIVACTQIEPAGWLTFDHGGYCYQAAVEGVGVAIGEPIFVDADIKAGRLYYPFQQSYQDNISYYFLPPTGSDKPGVREFGEWLVRRAKSDVTAALVQSNIGSFSGTVAAFSADSI
jgi:LysR family glycine cleavage system transcriptional activator